MFYVYYCDVLISITSDFSLVSIVKSTIESLFVSGFLKAGMDSVFVDCHDMEGGDD